MNNKLLIGLVAAVVLMATVGGSLLVTEFSVTADTEPFVNLQVCGPEQGNVPCIHFQECDEDLGNAPCHVRSLQGGGGDGGQHFGPPTPTPGIPPGAHFWADFNEEDPEHIRLEVHIDHSPEAVGSVWTYIGWSNHPITWGDVDMHDAIQLGCSTPSSELAEGGGFDTIIPFDTGHHGAYLAGYMVVFADSNCHHQEYAGVFHTDHPNGERELGEGGQFFGPPTPTPEPSLDTGLHASFNGDGDLVVSITNADEPLNSAWAWIGWSNHPIDYEDIQDDAIQLGCTPSHSHANSDGGYTSTTTFQTEHEGAYLAGFIYSSTDGSCQHIAEGGVFATEHPLGLVEEGLNPGGQHIGPPTPTPGVPPNSEFNAEFTGPGNHHIDVHIENALHPINSVSAMAAWVDEGDPWSTVPQDHMTDYGCVPASNELGNNGGYRTTVNLEVTDKTGDEIVGYIWAHTDGQCQHSNISGIFRAVYPD